MSAPLLEARALHKAFCPPGREEVRVLEGVDLTLREGESAALSGPSGSGKSTLTHLLAGTEEPSSGEVLWRGAPLPAAGREERALWRLSEVGLIFQDFRLFPHLTALENAALPLELLGEAPRAAEERAAALLGEVGLGARAGHLPSELSGGEQQRVAIARALAHRPALIIADEPTGNLDWRSAGRVADLLFELPARHRVALLVVTHDLALAARATRHWRVEGGRLVEVPSAERAAGAGAAAQAGAEG